MLSRASQLTRLNAAYIFRQLSASPTTLSKQTHLGKKETQTTNEQEANSPSSLASNVKSGGQVERTRKNIQNNQYNNNNNNRTRPSGYQSGENYNQNNLSKCFFL